MQQSENNKIVSAIVTGLSILLCVFALAYIAGAFNPFHIYFPERVQRAIFLAFLLPIAFLAYPMMRGKWQGKLVWLNYILALASILGLLYFIFFFEQVEEHFLRVSEPSALEMTVAMLALVLSIEAIRRVVGWPMALVVLIFLIYPFVTQYAPGILHGRVYSLERITGMLFVSSDGLLGIALGVAATIVVMFVMFGQVLLNTGGGKFFIDLAVGLLGHVRGGPAKAAVVASALFGTISGSSTANVATTGMITIPLMKGIGYRSSFAGGVEAVASNGGVLLPPVMGAVAFIIAEFLAIPYIMVCFYALVPAVLYFVAVFVMVDLEAARTGLKGLPRQDIPPVKKTMKEGWFYLLPLVLLVFLLAVLFWSPQKAAFWSLIAFWVISLFKKETRLGPAGILKVFKGTARAMCTVGFACAGAGIIIGAISMTTLGFKFSGALIDISGGSMLALLMLTATACFIMGMGIGAITAYITLAVLIAPVLIQMGVIPIAAHLFVFWWGLTAYITPPIAINAFVASGIAEASPIRTSLQATRLGICNLILPFIFVFNPALILIGSPTEVIIAIFTATLAVAALAASLIGYLLTPIKWQRFLLFAGAICLLVPDWESSIVGVVLIAAVVLLQIRDWRYIKLNTPLA
ncbi:TRAP transporter permease [Bacteroidota bacterium]